MFFKHQLAVLYNQNHIHIHTKRENTLFLPVVTWRNGGLECFDECFVAPLLNAASRVTLTNRTVFRDIEPRADRCVEGKREHILKPFCPCVSLYHGVCTAWARCLLSCATDLVTQIVETVNDKTSNGKLLVYNSERQVEHRRTRANRLGQRRYDFPLRYAIASFRSDVTINELLTEDIQRYAAA